MSIFNQFMGSMEINEIAYLMVNGGRSAVICRTIESRMNACLPRIQDRHVSEHKLIRMKCYYMRTLSISNTSP